MSWSPEVTKDGRLPIELFRSSPRPLTAGARSCCQSRNACRVTGSKAWKISSSSTEGLTREAFRKPPSLTAGAPGVPGVISR